MALQPLEHDELVHAIDELRLKVPLHLLGSGAGLKFKIWHLQGGGPESAAVYLEVGALYEPPTAARSGVHIAHKHVSTTLGCITIRPLSYQTLEGFTRGSDSSDCMSSLIGVPVLETASFPAPSMETKVKMRRSSSMHEAQMIAPFGMWFQRRVQGLKLCEIQDCCLEVLLPVPASL